MKKDWFKVSFYIELPEEEIKNMDIYSHLDFLPDCKKYKYDNVCMWRAKEYSKEGKVGGVIDHKKLSKINNSTFDKISNDVKENLEGYNNYVDRAIGTSIGIEQTLTPHTKKKIEKLSRSFAFTDNDHNVQDKINEIIDYLNNQNK